MIHSNGSRPFDDYPTLEDDLRAQIAELHAERQDLRTAIDLLHRAAANLDAENCRLRHENARLRHRAQAPRRWWPW